MSKASLVTQAEIQITKGQTFLFDELKSNLFKQGLSEQDEIIKTITILRNETYQSYKDKKLELNQRYLKKLRMLTVLTLFQGCSSYSITKLSRELEMKIEDISALLIEASINQLLSIQIDEEKGQIKIIQSKLRQREVDGQSINTTNNKALLLLQKNYRNQIAVTSLVKDMTKKTQKKFQFPIDSLLRNYSN